MRPPSWSRKNVRDMVSKTGAETRDHHETFITSDGCTLRYRLRGDGPLIALTPGGREPGEGVAALADDLARGATVLTWDRRNAGASDVWFGGESEQAFWADDLSDLIQSLGKVPAWLAGGSAGARVRCSRLCGGRKQRAACCYGRRRAGPIAASFSASTIMCLTSWRPSAPGWRRSPKRRSSPIASPHNPENRERHPRARSGSVCRDHEALEPSFYYSPDAALAGVPDKPLRSIAHSNADCFGQ